MASLMFAPVVAPPLLLPPPDPPPLLAFRPDLLVVVPPPEPPDPPDPPDCLSGHLSRGAVAVLICLSILGSVALFVTCIVIRIHNSRRFNSPRRWHSGVAAATVTQQPREMTATRGLDQSTIETYKKMELGESRRPPGTNGIVCPICLSEYANKETVRFIPECEHCFHVKCIDVWLKIHGSCPLCRNLRA